MQVNLTEDQAVLILNLLESHLSTQKNWIASAVERGTNEYGDSGQTGLEYAQGLVPKLRLTEQTFAAFNRALRS